MATGSGFGWDSKDGATSHRRVLLKRRGFLKRSLSAVVGSGAFVSSSGVEGRAHGKNAATPLNGPIRFAQIGVGGQGAIDLQGVIAAGGTPAAFCDVDVQRAGKTYEAHPHVPRFTDYRVMLDRMSNEIDGVVISTPVHQHGAQAVDAIRRGLHVFVQTPMVRTIEELDAVSAAARKHGVVTQVGINLNQLSPSKSWAKPELGTIRRVQAWTDRPNWPQGMDSIPKPTTPPVSLDWDLWLGPSAKRPFAKGYLPGAWRAWCDFGCGAIGDVFPHHVQDLFRDAGLGVPTELVAKSCSGADVSFPLWSEITFQLNSSDDDGLPISLVWYDGNRRPESGSLSASGPLEEPSDPVAVRKTDADEVPVVAADTSPESSGGSGSGAPQLIDRPISVRRNGCAVIGSRLTLAGEGFGQVPKPIAKSIPMPNSDSSDDILGLRKQWQQQLSSSRLAGQGRGNVYEQWVRAIQSGDPELPTHRVDVVRPMNETMLLGCIAMRFKDRTLRWNQSARQFHGNDEANELLKFTPRDGFDLIY